MRREVVGKFKVGRYRNKTNLAAVLENELGRERIVRLSM